MLPLCLPRRVASLRYFSIIGVTLVICFVLAVVAHSSTAGLPHLHELKYFATGIDAVNGLTLFIFAFLGHGLCFRLFDEMRHPSARDLLLDACGSVSLIGMLCFVVGFFGYAEFGLDISGSILKYYHVRSDPMMLAAYMGILLKICVAYALSGQACRLPIFYILKNDIDSCPYQLHLGITAPLCVCSLILGLLMPDINIGFNLLGSMCGGVLAFLLPSFLVYLGGWTLHRVGWVRMGLTYVNMIAGVLAIVFGTAVTIGDMVKRYGWAAAGTYERGVVRVAAHEVALLGAWWHATHTGR
ncbi:Transmembrane amino acid transporter protein, putative [Leishmania donovani]|uniref:Transmembrane amino acid transporter protein, putative n=1 Tax=Leishmania donovani TaxID=5661 RepID=A0A451EJH9_LEIDO|nr:Transmembrane amino acid transporter protein, putative [Leishmania donovani]